MRCIIHIGTEKTGSTAIQRYLWTNRDALMETGVYLCRSMGEGNNRALPAAVMSLEKEDDFTRRMSFASAEERRAWCRTALGRLEEEIHEVTGQAEIFLISSEHFHSRLQHPDEVRALKDFLAPHFDEFEIVCYLRRQDRMARSLYSQALRAGYTPETTLPLARMKARKPGNLPPYFDFSSLLQRWADAFGEHSVKPLVYSRGGFHGGDIVHDFLHTTGLRSDLPVQPEPSNPALSCDAQAVLLRVNALLERDVRSDANRLRDALVDYLERNAPGKSRLPTEEEAREYYRYFEESNSQVARRWFDRAELFDDDFSQYPAEPPLADPDRVADLLAGFMLDQLAVQSGLPSRKAPEAREQG
jgi:hypothetical protein